MVTVEDLVAPSDDWVTFFKFPQLKYEGSEAVDGIDLCCPDVRIMFESVRTAVAETLRFRAAGQDRRKASSLTRFRGSHATCRLGSSRPNS